MGNKYNCEIYAVEPEIDNYNILKKNIEINKINAKIFNVAVSDKNGKAKFFIDLEERGGHESSLRPNSRNEGRTTIVEVMKLDDIIPKYTKKKVGLIKIDTEGVEIKVLKGSERIILKDKPNIIFEAVNDEEYEKIKKYLIKYGYKCKRGEYLTHFASIDRTFAKSSAKI